MTNTYCDDICVGREGLREFTVKAFGRDFNFMYPDDFDEPEYVYRSNGVVWVSAHEPHEYPDEIYAGDEAIEIGEMEGKNKIAKNPGKIKEIKYGSI